MARGMGLMGEAGPEGVLPLARTAGGDLGVRTTGNSGPPNITVNVVNETGTKADAEIKDLKMDWENMTFTLLLKKLKASPDARGSLAAAMGR